MSARLLLLFALACLIQACTLPAPPEPSSPSAREKIRAELAADRPLAALRLLAETGAAKQERFATEYAAAITGVIEAADRSRRIRQYAEAGGMLRQLLELWPENAALAGRLDSSREEVRTALGDCADRLMDRGLGEYRQGRLEEAIAAWRQVLALDPAHPAAAQALQTASLQLKNLRALE